MTLAARIQRAIRAFTLKDFEDQMNSEVLGAPTLSGAVVDRDTALTFSAFYNGVQQISQTVASLPFPVYRRLSETQRERYRTHNLWAPLNRKASPYMTAFTWRETMTHHALVWGNGYSYKLRDRAGRVIGFVLLNPERTDVQLKDGRPIYVHKTRSNEPKELAWDDVFHLPGIGFDGLRGYSVLTVARESLGVGLALQEFGARFFGQGTNVGGVIKRPATAPKLSPEASTRLKNDLREQWEGLTKANKLLVLEEGMEYDKVGMPLDDAQFLASKQFSIQDIARWLNMPPHKLKDMSRSTFSNIEQEQLSYVVDTIRPWLVRWESSVNNFLVQDYEQNDIFCEHLVDALLRGDISTRYAALATARQNGIINANEWRQLENWNPIEGEAGEAYLVQGAMIPTSSAGKTPALPEPESPAEPDEAEEDPEPPAARQRAEAHEVNVRVLGSGYEEKRTRQVSVLRDAAGNLIGANIVEEVVTPGGNGHGE